MLLRVVVAVFAAGMIWAQGTTPKPKPEDYPAHASLGTKVLAADNMIHSVPTPTGMYLAEEYMVIEVAVYGPALSRASFSAGQFQLRVNGRALASIPPQFAAAAIKDPFAGDGPRLTGTAGIGDRGVIIGGPSRQPRFPGDPTARRAPGVDVPQAPNRAGIEKEAPASVDELVNRAAFPEGEHSLPIAGVLFFPFKGKMKSVKSVELLYDGELGSARVKLQ